MNVYIFVALECLAFFLNLAFVIAVWSRAKFGVFLKWMMTGLVFVNLLTNAQCMALDVSMAAGIYLGWPVCFTQFLNAPFCIFATLMLVTCINGERIVAIKWPVFYRNHFTRNKAFAVMVSCLALAMILSLFGLPDLLQQYESSTGNCLPTDLYPRRYATVLVSVVCTVLLATALTSFMLNVRVLIQFSKQKLVRSNDAPSFTARRLSRGALVASRIAVASAFLYTWSVGYLVFFLFWGWITKCDDMCFATGDLSFTAAVLQILVTIQDPLVYFISNAKWSSIRKFFNGTCGTKIGTNHVAPYHMYTQGSSYPFTTFRVTPTPTTTNSQIQSARFNHPLQAREAVVE